MPRGAKARPVSRDRDKNPTENYIFLDIDSRGCSARERDQSNGPIARNNNNAPMSLFGASAESRVCNFSGYIGARARFERERERERTRRAGRRVYFPSLSVLFALIIILFCFPNLLFAVLISAAAGTIIFAGQS